MDKITKDNFERYFTISVYAYMLFNKKKNPSQLAEPDRPVCRYI